MKIKFAFLEAKTSLSERQRLKTFIASLFKENKKELGSLTYIFCTDLFLLEMNRKFLKHDYFTDIITFDLTPPNKGIEGEVYISVDRVNDNARKLKLTIKEELHRVIFHGVLHLCGYKDKSKKDKKIMRTEENRCLSKYFG